MKTINKTKNIVLLAGICAAVLLAAGCNDDKNVLANTKWKLVGIVNTETGEIKELEPKGEPRDENCYTFIFNANGTFTGHSASNDLMGKYTIDPNTSAIVMSVGVMTERGEVYDGNLYMNCFRTRCSSSIVDGCLRLYYDNQENYLWYKRVAL